MIMQNCKKRIDWTRGNGTTVMGMGLVFLILIFAFVLMQSFLIRQNTYNTQLAADALADSIAMYGYKEHPTYHEATEEMKHVVSLIKKDTSLLPKNFKGKISLDKQLFEEEDTAYVTITSNHNYLIDLFGSSYYATRSAKTYFPKKHMNNQYTGSSRIPYVQWCILIANNNEHGYSMPRRGGNPDYDCSSFVTSALIKSGDYPNAYVTSTHAMNELLLDLGFERHPFNESELVEGDILLYISPTIGHTEIYVGSGMTVGAHSDYDKVPGDSSGNEINVQPLSRHDYNYYYRDPNLAMKLRNPSTVKE